MTSFLICGSHRAILFDTGLGIRDIKKVAEELYDGQITVINSHCHFDHIGNNWRFDKVVVFDDEYAMHTAAAGVPCQMIADQAAEEAFSGGYPEGFSPKDLFAGRTAFLPRKTEIFQSWRQKAGIYPYSRPQQ